MKLDKIYAKAKEYLEVFDEKEIKKKKIKELKNKIEDKISDLKKQSKKSDEKEKIQSLKDEIGALKGILEKLEAKK